MEQRGSEVRVVSAPCPIRYEDGYEEDLRAGTIAGAFLDFVAAPEELVEVAVNHPVTGVATTAVVPAWMVQI